MTESNNDTKQEPGSRQTAAAKARRTAADATAPVSRGAKKAAATTDDVASAAKDGAGRAAGATTTAAYAGAEKLEAGRRAVVTASGRVAATARTAWTLIARRRLVAVAVGTGLTAVSATSYALGRRAGRPAQGPLTRLTGGRI